MIASDVSISTLEDSIRLELLMRPPNCIVSFVRFHLSPAVVMQRQGVARGMIPHTRLSISKLGKMTCFPGARRNAKHWSEIKIIRRKHVLPTNTINTDKYTNARTNV